MAFKLRILYQCMDSRLCERHTLANSKRVVSPDSTNVDNIQQGLVGYQLLVWIQHDALEHIDPVRGERFLGPS